MRNVINIVARLLTSAFAIMIGVRLTIIGLLAIQMGGWTGSILIAMAFIFFVPALLTLFGGRMKWIRWLWGGMAALSLAAMLVPAAHEAGMITLIGSLVTLVVSFGAREKKAEEEEDVSAFS